MSIVIITIITLWLVGAAQDGCCIDTSTHTHTHTRGTVGLFRSFPREAIEGMFCADKCYRVQLRRLCFILIFIVL